MRWLQQLGNRIYTRRRRLATLLIALLTLPLAWHVVFGPNGTLAYSQKREESRKLKAQIEAIELENQRLEQQIQALKNDPKTIEREAREQLHYARPGEVVYTVPAQPDKTPPPAPATAHKH